VVSSQVGGRHGHRWHAGFRCALPTRRVPRRHVPGRGAGTVQRPGEVPGCQAGTGCQGWPVAGVDAGEDSYSSRATMPVTSRCGTIRPGPDIRHLPRSATAARRGGRGQHGPPGQGRQTGRCPERQALPLGRSGAESVRLLRTRQLRLQDPTASPPAAHRRRAIAGRAAHFPPPGRPRGPDLLHFSRTCVPRRNLRRPRSYLARSQDW
jgi:hypothetical protein